MDTDSEVVSSLARKCIVEGHHKQCFGKKTTKVPCMQDACCKDCRRQKEKRHKNLLRRGKDDQCTHGHTSIGTSQLILGRAHRKNTRAYRMQNHLSQTSTSLVQGCISS